MHEERVRADVGQEGAVRVAVEAADAGAGVEEEEGAGGVHERAEEPVLEGPGVAGGDGVGGEGGGAEEEEGWRW